MQREASKLSLFARIFSACILWKFDVQRFCVDLTMQEAWCSNGTDLRLGLWRKGQLTLGCIVIQVVIQVVIHGHLDSSSVDTFCRSESCMVKHGEKHAKVSVFFYILLACLEVRKILR